MAGLQINPADIETARAAGYSDAEIVGHLNEKAPEQFKAAKDAGYSDTEILSHFGGKKEASGAIAGAAHGVGELINGPLETAKRFAGVGPGRAPADPNYVPANVTNGSWNPANWSLSQLPQKFAEAVPSIAPDVASAAAGAKIGKKFGGLKGAALGALLGSQLSGTARTAGDTAKEVTVARTGDENAPSSTADLVRGGATAAAASAAAALLPTRFVPGLNGATKDVVGAAGITDALKRIAATGAIGSAGGVGSNAVTQAGLTVGTDKGLTVDTSQFPEAAVGGAVTGFGLGVPRFLGDTARAGSLAKFGGDNLAPTKNVATRLEAASAKLGNAKSDEAALATVKSDLTNELGDAVGKVRKQLPGLSPEADNALVRAQRGDKITPEEVQLIKRETAAAPDGANAAFLAHSLHAADLMAERGGHHQGKWSGGISGSFDRNVGYMLNPFRSATGALASGMGVHLLGTSSPQWAAAAFGTYGLARAFDGMTGMRSPAKTFVEHFAEQNAQLRKPSTAPPPGQPTAPWGPRPPMAGPTGPQVPLPGAPQAPQGPWGPKPLPTNAVPQVPPPGAPQPNLSPIALAMLKQSMKQGPQAAPAPDPEPINPLALPRDITTPAKNVVGGLMLAQKLKQDQQAKDAVASLPSPLMDESPLNVTGNPMIGKRASQLVSAAKALQKYTGADVAAKEEAQAAKAEEQAVKAQAREEKQAATQAERAQAKAEAAKARAEKAEAAVVKAKDKEAAKAELVKAKAAAAKAKEDAKLEMAKVKAAASVLKQATVKSAPAAKISKANGKFKATAEEAPSAFSPYAEERLYPHGISPAQYGKLEADAYLGPNVPRGRRENYEAHAEATARDRIDAINELKDKFPTLHNALDGVLRQLHKAGGNHDKHRAAVNHYANLLPEAAGQALRDAFK